MLSKQTKRDAAIMAWRTKFPYRVVASMTRDLWVGEGRDYRPLDAEVVTGGHGFGVMGYGYQYVDENRPARIMPFTADEPTEEFYLYHDGSKPWESKKLAKEYLERYALIHTLADRQRLFTLPYCTTHHFKINHHGSRVVGVGSSAESGRIDAV